MRALAICGLLLLMTSSADAQTRTAIVGRPLKISSINSTNPDCTTEGRVEIRVTQPPQHGRVTVRYTGVFPNFPASNVRSACNRRRVPGVEVYYVADKGYSGSDSVAIRAISAMGTPHDSTVWLNVQP
jgi:hypothetical protein